MKYCICFIVALLWLRPGQSHAQQVFPDSTAANQQNFYNMSLQELMDLEVTVASKQALTTRESPGIVSLITEEEIIASGARDLIDILRMIPGFDFCVDVEGVVGLAVRGNWAHEGKALLLIDGIEMNENLYSTLQFGNHYTVDDVKRIEIIRGPGSAMYGGNAEYAVINIITRSASDLNGVMAKATYGMMGSAPGKYSASMSAGQQVNDFGYTLSVFTGKAIRSNRTYADFWDGSYQMADYSDLNSNYVNVGMQFKKLQFRGILDRYTLETKDNYDVVMSKTYPIKFDSYIGELKQEITVSPFLVIIPKLNVKVQVPWRYNGEVYNNEFNSFFVRSSRYTGGISTSWNPSMRINVLGGVEYFYDMAEQQAEKLFVSNGTSSLKYNNTSLYGQASLITKLADLTAGARYNYNDRYEDSFVPRLSITKAFDKVHFKFLYSQAYRSPGTENIDLNTDILPERTTVMEMEAGVKLFPTLYATGNLFDITTRDPIQYFYDNSTDQDGYFNAKQTGTRGVEFDLQWKCCKGYIGFTYGYYNASHKNKLEANSVPGKSSSLLAVPNHKLTLSSNFQFGKYYSINPSISFHSQRYGVTGMDEFDEPVIGAFESILLLNLSFRTEEFLIKGLSAGISLFNILDEDDSYLQPYAGGHAELPGAGREIVMTLSYRFVKK